MRHSIQRSILRAAIAVGVIFSHHQAAYSVSWKDLLTPHAGVCFLHDLDWERFSSVSIHSEVKAESTVESFPSDRIRIPMQQDFDECVAAAKRFEVETQVNRLWEYLSQHAGQLQGAVADTTRRYSSAWRGMVHAIVEHAGRIANKTVHPELLPITQVEPSTLSAVAGNGVASEDDFFDDAAVNWNWDDRACVDTPTACPPQDQVVVAALKLPHRNGPNMIVHMLEETVEEVILADDSDVVEGIHDNSGEVSEPSRNVWQVGVDPICPELTSSYYASVCGNYETSCFETEEIATASQVEEVEPSVSPQNHSIAFDDINDSGVRHCKMVEQDSSVEQLSAPNVDKLELLAQIRDCINQVLPRWTPSSNPWQSVPAAADRQAEEVVNPVSVQEYSRDDLRYANRLAERIFSSVVENHPLPENDSLDHTPDLQTILLPLSVSQRIALDYVQEHLIQPANQWRLIASKSLARQLRSLGQTMMDASLKMEQQASNLEVAYRLNNKTVK